MDESPWKIRGYRAHLRTPVWQMSIDLLQPQQGFMDVQVSGVLLTGCQLMQVVPAGYTGRVEPESLIEAYIRGLDLIATYAESSATHVKPQIYWRALPGGSALSGVELILSAQTSRLESQPLMWSQARWTDTEVWRLIDPDRELFENLESGGTLGRILSREHGTSLVLLRPHQLRYSLAMAVFPSDFQQADLQSVERPEGEQLRYWLFPEALEKGVIRRGRLRAWILPRDTDTLSACQAYREFLAAPLPLTV